MVLRNAPYRDGDETEPNLTKILFLDIENTANEAHVWGLWSQNVGLPMLRKPSYILCFALSWVDGPTAWFKATDENMKRLWQAFDDADIVVTYNGKKHDIPHIQRRFLELGMTPPSPFKHVDLYQTVRRQFKFPSNKLEYVVKALKLGTKATTGGYELWLAVMEDNPKAWKRMERYNKRDVTILKKLYKRVRPWIKNHPNTALFAAQAGVMACPTCGSSRLQRRGFGASNSLIYQRFRCMNCGTWSRNSKSAGPKPSAKMMPRGAME